MNAEFGTLVEAYRGTLQHAALKLCHGDAEFAEDMVQDTLLKALRHADRFLPGTNLQAWLQRILYNTVMSAYRHRQASHEGPYPEGFDPAGAEDIDAEVSDEVSKAVSALPEDYRKIFLMAALEESPYQDIAEKLGIPVGTVMSRLWRARRALQQRLEAVSLN